MSSEQKPSLRCPRCNYIGKHDKRKLLEQGFKSCLQLPLTNCRTPETEWHHPVGRTRYELTRDDLQAIFVKPLELRTRNCVPISETHPLVRPLSQLDISNWYEQNVNGNLSILILLNSLISIILT